MFRSTVSLALFVLLTGCASQIPFLQPFQAYDGPHRPTSEVATVFAQPFGPAGYDSLHGYIAAVDGRETIGFSTPAPLEVYVLPGQHELQMVAGDGQARRADGVFAIEVQAGHSYEVMARFASSDTVEWWLEDRGVDYLRRDPIYREAQERGFVPPFLNVPVER